MTTFPPAFETFTELLQWRAQSHPKKVAFRYFPDGEHETHTLSYEALDQQARQLATYLHGHGYSGERLLLLFPPDLSFIVGFVACLYAGAIPVPAYPPEPHRLSHTLKRLHKIIEDAQASAILTVSALAKAAQNLPLTPLQWLESDTLLDDAKAVDPQSVLHRPTKNDIAFLQYTSGSTGDPKGVIITHRNLMANQKMIQEAFEHTEQAAKLVCWVPFYHDMGLVGHLLQSLYVGGETLIMPPTAFLKKPVRWLRLISEHRATSTGAPNFAFDLCVRKITEAEKEGLDLSSLRMALNGAEPVQAETLQRFVETFAPYGLNPHTPYPAYGMAEATVFITGGERKRRPFYLRVDKAALAEHRIEILSQAIATPPSPPALPKPSLTLVSSGRTWQKGRLRIVDPNTCSPLPNQQIGEIWIQGPHVAAGYWQRPEASAYTFSARLAETPSETYCRTGDLGFCYQDQWFVTGRLKDLIIVRGRNIYPQDLERSVDTWAKQEPIFGSSLRLGCGIAIGHQEAEPSTEAVVFLQEIRDPSFQDSSLKNQIKTALQAHLNQEHGLPIHEVVLLPPGALPKTSSGKLMRAQAAQSYRQSYRQNNDPNQHPKKPAAPKSPSPSMPSKNSATTQALSHWLLHWLQKEAHWPNQHLPLQQNFQTLGLDSLLSVRLVADLEQHLQRPLPETLLWDYTTPAALLHHLKPLSSPNDQHGRTPKSPNFPAASDIPTAPVAIIGMSCRFPGGVDSPEVFWKHLLAGTDSITPIPTENWRWPHAAYYAPRNPSGLPTPGKTYVRHGGFLENVYDFDPTFFQISPKEAIDLDPQQRMLLMLSWEAFESAGLIPEHYRHSQTGVFIGLSNLDYSLRHMHSADPHNISAYSGTGVSPSTAAGRIAYTFDFHGPAITLDTACSSSLVAIHQACQSLRSGDADLALAGGVNLILSPEGHIYFSQLQVLSEEGSCKPFADTADGFVRSEGGGLVLLKPLAAALRDKNPILGIIASSAVNHNGASNGLTAPSGLAQQQLLKKALKKAQVKAHEIDYLEAHGTGSPLGDPIEAAALHTVFIADQPVPREHPLTIGSVKSQIGHSESASGIASVIKTLLILKHQQIPAKLHSQKRHPRLAKLTHLDFPQVTHKKSVRKAGVSSFGISGTNAHLILSSIDPSDITPSDGVPLNTSSAPLSTPVPIGLSAPDPQTLTAKIAQLSHWLSLPEQMPSIDLIALSHTLLHHRTAFAYRWGAYVKDIVTLTTQLQQAQKQPHKRGPAVNTPITALVFPGQEGQRLDMKQELMLADPVFKACLVSIDKKLKDPVHAQGYKLPGTLIDCFDQKVSLDLHKPPHIQLFLFTLQVALAKTWIAHTNSPHYLIGHGLGEVAAAYIAEAITLDDALTILRCHSRWPVEALETELLETLSTVKKQVPRLPLWSTSLNKWVEAEDLSPAYWHQHLRQATPFDTGIETLLAQGVNLWVEMIPHPVLTQKVHESAQAKGIPVHTFAPLRQNHAEQSKQTEQTGFWQTLIHYYEAGGALANTPQKAAQKSSFTPPILDLPPFPWQGKPYERKQMPTALTTPPPAPLPSADLPLHWHVAWEPNPLPQTNLAPGPAGDWLVFCDPQELQWSLEMLLKGRGQSCLWVQRGHELQLEQKPFMLDDQKPEHYKKLFQQLSERTMPLKGVIFTWEAQEQTFLPEAAQEHYLRLVALLQGIKAFKGVHSSPRLYVLTRQIQLSGITRGLLHAAFYEYPQWHCTHIDIGEQTAPRAYQLLATELLSQSTETQIRLHTHREVARLSPGPGKPEPLQPLSSAATAPQGIFKTNWQRLFKRNTPHTPSITQTAASVSAVSVNGPSVNGKSTYLITGGLGRLGRQSVEWLATQGAKHLVLIDPQEIPTETQQAWLRAFQEQWQAVQGNTLQIFQGDISQAQELSRCLEDIASSPYPLRGIIHSTGTMNDNPAALALKIQSTWNLHTLTQQQGIWLDFFVCYASVTVALDTPEQSSNAAANGFIDQLMGERQAQGLQGLSLQWGPWERSELAKENGLTELSSLLQSGAPAVKLMRFQMTKLLQAFPHAQHLPFFDYLSRSQGSMPPLPPSPPQPLPQPLAQSDLRDQSVQHESAIPGDIKAITAFLTHTVAQILSLSQEQIDPQRPLRGYGFDSLMALELKAQLQAKYGLNLKNAEGFQSMSLTELSERLCYPERFKGTSATDNPGPED